MMKGKQDIAASRNLLPLKVEDEDDAQTVISTAVPGSPASITASQLNSPLASPKRRGTVEDARRVAGRTSSNATTVGVGGIEEVPTTTGGDYDEDDRVTVDLRGLLRGGKDGTTTPPLPRGGAQGGHGASPTVEEPSVPFGRAWRQRQQQQQQQNYIREATLKQDREQLGIRHHIVAADAMDIQRLEEGKNIVLERARYAVRRETNGKPRPSEVRYVGAAVYDVHFLRDDTNLWHRRTMADRRSGGWARMLCRA